MKKNKLKGIFITLEGGEGSGKTTHLSLLKEYLLSQGYSVVTSHEPGGTVIGGMIRDVLLDPSHKGMVPLSELLLYLASRAQHIEEIILPAMRKGRIIICDRFPTPPLPTRQCAGHQEDMG
jgi:dTMP kinase